MPCYCGQSPHASLLLSTLSYVHFTWSWGQFIILTLYLLCFRVPTWSCEHGVIIYSGLNIIKCALRTRAVCDKLGAIILSSVALWKMRMCVMFFIEGPVIEGAWGLILIKSKGEMCTRWLMKNIHGWNKYPYQLLILITWQSSRSRNILCTGDSKRILQPQLTQDSPEPLGQLLVLNSTTVVMLLIPWSNSFMDIVPLIM